jgi:RNA polymerase sigma factor (sigma-70 family)
VCRPFDGEGDVALLRRMCGSELDATGARDAWAEFYRRHHGYLYSVCRRAHRSLIGDDRVFDLIHDTFIRAFQRACSFHGAGDADLDGQQRLARAWLGAVSEHVVRDYFRREPQVEFVDVEPFADDSGPGREATSEPPVSLLDAALETLTDREQEVLRTTALWYKPGERHQRLPNKIMEQLMTSLGTSSANVRQIRVRAIAKVKSFMDSHTEDNSSKSES